MLSSIIIYIFNIFCTSLEVVLALITITTKRNSLMLPPKATFLLGSHCPHCPTVLQHLSDLVKKGDLSQLSVINIEVAPELARNYGVRSVPWIKIGDYILTGLQPLDALKQRIEWSNNKNKLLGKFDALLSTGKAQQVTDAIKEDEQRFDVIMQLLADPATILSTRIGIGVVMEDFEGTELLASQLEALAALLNATDSRVRADAAHYLSLTHSKDAIPYLEKHRNDEDAEVSEVVEDSLIMLQS